MRIKFLVPAALAAVAAAGLTIAPSAAPQRTHVERHALVTAYSDAATPALGLTATDFVIREDGLAREVIRVGTAPPPTHVMLLIDDSQAALRSIQFLRTAVPAFIAQMATLTPAPQIAVMTFGERPTMRADFQSKPEAATAAAAKLFATPGTGSYLLQALMDASKNLTKRQAASPVIVAFADDSGPEFSSERREQVSGAMQRANASLWAIVMQASSRMDQSIEGIERQAVLHDVVKETGGFTRTILSDQSVGPAFDNAAALIKARYLVTYSRPDQTIPPKTVEITTKRNDVKVVASRWAK
jgi:hypothetical protein